MLRGHFCYAGGVVRGHLSRAGPLVRLKLLFDLRTQLFEFELENSSYKLHPWISFKDITLNLLRYSDENWDEILKIDENYSWRKHNAQIQEPQRKRTFQKH